MKALLDQAVSLVATATAGLRFSRFGSDSLFSVEVYNNVLPPRDTDDLDSLAPFCLVTPGQGGRNDKSVRRLALVFCLYQEERSDAVEELSSLEDAVSSIAHPGAWTPWVLREHSDYFGLDREKPGQPHPLYYYTVLLDLMTDNPNRNRPWRV